MDQIPWDHMAYAAAIAVCVIVFFFTFKRQIANYLENSEEISAYGLKAKRTPNQSQPNPEQEKKVQELLDDNYNPSVREREKSIRQYLKDQGFEIEGHV